MSSRSSKSLAEYRKVSYPYQVTEEDGEFFINFPDLPGCITQVERAEEINTLAMEIKGIWLESAWESGQQIPQGPAQDFSGKFIVRIPRSLHRDLTYQARDEGMSLNSFVMHLLSLHSGQIRLEKMIVSEVVSQIGMRRSSNMASVNHRLMFTEANPFNSRDSDCTKRAVGSMGREGQTNTSAHTVNPKPKFAT